MPRDHTNRFEIAFDTKEMPGRVIATQVTLTRRVLGQKDFARVDLSDHPLCPQLWRYCQNNPPSNQADTSGGSPE